MALFTLLYLELCAHYPGSASYYPLLYLLDPVLPLSCPSMSYNPWSRPQAYRIPHQCEIVDTEAQQLELWVPRIHSDDEGFTAEMGQRVIGDPRDGGSSEDK